MSFSSLCEGLKEKTGYEDWDPLKSLALPSGEKCLVQYINKNKFSQILNMSQSIQYSPKANISGLSGGI